ncbi:hypothetical protein SLE2022_031840 [Rubroshorea leprosula]
MGNDRHRKSMFLPILCSSSSSSVHDPFSPRISCTGQIKRNNKITGFPTSQPHNNNNNVKYVKLKRLFSSSSSSSSRTSRNGTKNDYPIGSTRISMDELDPPLPVIKRASKEERQPPNTLWERRSGGVELKSLQLQQIQPNRHRLQPITTV